MRRVLWNAPLRVGNWVCKRLGCHFEPDHSTAIGLERNGDLIAGTLFDHYNGRSVAMHIAAEGQHWATREFFESCFAYAFLQLGVKKALGFVDSMNTKARRLNEHLGFMLESTVRDAGEQGDLLIYTMTPNQCRFLEVIRHGKKRQDPEAARSGRDGQCAGAVQQGHRGLQRGAEPV